MRGRTRALVRDVLRRWLGVERAEGMAEFAVKEADGAHARIARDVFPALRELKVADGEVAARAIAYTDRQLERCEFRFVAGEAYPWEHENGRKGEYKNDVNNQCGQRRFGFGNCVYLACPHRPHPAPVPQEAQAKQEQAE